MALINNFQIRMPYKTGIPRDVSIMTFNFANLGADVGAEFAAQGAALYAWFNEVPPGGSSVTNATYLSQWIDRSHCTVRVVQIETATGAEVGTPSVIPFALDATTNTLQLPLEVAVCNSVYGSLSGAGTVKGRNFFGPLNGQALGGLVGTEPPRVATQLRAGLVAASKNMQNTLDGASGVGPWVIWTRKNHGFAIVEGGFVDDAFDTQRRRGNDPTSRDMWTNL